MASEDLKKKVESLISKLKSEVQEKDLKIIQLKDYVNGARRDLQKLAEEKENLILENRNLKAKNEDLEFSNASIQDDKDFKLRMIRDFKNADTMKGKINSLIQYIERTMTDKREEALEILNRGEDDNNYIDGDDMMY